MRHFDWYTLRCKPKLGNKCSVVQWSWFFTLPLVYLPRSESQNYRCTSVSQQLRDRLSKFTAPSHLLNSMTAHPSPSIHNTYRNSRWWYFSICLISITVSLRWVGQYSRTADKRFEKWFHRSNHVLPIRQKNIALESLSRALDHDSGPISGRLLFIVLYLRKFDHPLYIVDFKKIISTLQHTSDLVL